MEYYMFETNYVAWEESPHHEHGYSLWTYVVKTDSEPWFQITWCSYSEFYGLLKTEQRLIAGVPLLLAHLKGGERHFVSDVLIVIPPAVNSLEKCRVESLDKIFRRGSGENIYYYFELEGGRLYSGSSSGETTKARIVFDRNKMKIPVKV